MPAFSYTLLNLSIPTYTLPVPSINFELNSYPKSVTPSAQYLQLYQQLCNTKFAEFHHVYTDGSKQALGVGAAAVSGTLIRMASLPKVASIYSAEAHAVQLAMDIIFDSPHRTFVVFTDSCSVLRSLLNIYTTLPVIRRLIHKLYRLSTSNKTVHFCWIPSHIGIRGNEAADHAAFVVASRPSELVPIYYRDLYPILLTAFTSRRNQKWRMSGSKLLEIKRDVGYWPPLVGLSRRDEVIINRLRSGHCYFSHGYLMDVDFEGVPNVCEICQDALLTVKHIFVSCVALRAARNRMAVCRENPDYTLAMILGPQINCTDVLGFLRDINLYAVV